MQSAVAFALVAMLAVASAGLIAAPAVTLVRSAPIVHAAHPVAYAHHAPVVYAHHAPIAYASAPVIKTIAPAPIVYSAPVHKTIVHGVHPVLL